MSALPWVAGGLGLGLLYYVWRQSQVPAGPNDYCAALCKAAGSFCVDGGWSCRETNSVLGSVAQGVENFADPGGVYWGERDRREGVNNNLNGPGDIFNSPEGVGISPYNVTHVSDDPQTVAAKTLRYKNGCVPLYGSPGFAACKTGTLDMYNSAVNLDAGSPYDHLAEPELTAAGAYISKDDRDAAGSNGRNLWVKINKGTAMTGGSGDPTTQGPFGPDYVNAPYWYVRGQKAIGTSTMAPRAVVMQHYATGHPGAEETTDQQIANLTDAQALELVPINQDPNVIVTQIGKPCGTPNPGFSWVSTNTKTGAGYWTRTKVGFTDTMQPCPIIANGNVAHTIEISP